MTCRRELPCKISKQMTLTFALFRQSPSMTQRQASGQTLVSSDIVTATLKSAFVWSMRFWLWMIPIRHQLTTDHQRNKKKSTYQTRTTQPSTLLVKLLGHLEQPNRNLRKSLAVKFQSGAKAHNLGFSIRMSAMMSPYMYCWPLIKMTT